MAYPGQNKRLAQVGGNSTETATMEGDKAASSVPLPSPTAKKSPTGVSSHTNDSSVSIPSPLASKMPTWASSPTSPKHQNATSPTAGDMSSPASAPVPFPSRFTKAPVPNGNDKTSPASKMSPPKMGVKSLITPMNVIIAAVVVGGVTVLLFWKFCKAWKLRREKQRLRLQSTRVDMVLGDMQMVGMDEYDGDDPELI
mmetsp:Transcript_34364/g.81002  ORF Transcript_34364/g.81002 Transcript_34364/m.81002 type:complete len:198 (+) Transcript_34364:424-1017(+)